MGKISGHLPRLIAAATLLGAGAWLIPAANGFAEPQEQSGTMKDLLSRGGSWSCSVSRPAANHPVQGTIFVGGGKARADLTLQTANGPIESHMISDGAAVYMWSSAMPGSGFKMAVPAHEGAAPSAPPAGNPQAKLYTQSFNYNCTPWTADAAEFVLPKGVSFTDMSAVIGGIKAGAKPQGGTAVPGVNCSLCDQTPQGPARDQCRKALHCG